MLVARQLVDEFKGVKGFYPAEKMRRITWFDQEEVGANGGVEGWGAGRNRKRRRGVGGDIEMRVEELQSRLQGSLGIYPGFMVFVSGCSLCRVVLYNGC